MSLKASFSFRQTRYILESKQQMPSSPLSILQSDRVSTATRRVLESRLSIPEDYQSTFFDADVFALLRAAVDALLPQDKDQVRIPIAAQIDMRLAHGEGAGWRYAELPADPQAYLTALRLMSELLKTGATHPESQPASLAALLLAIQGKEHDTDDFPVSRWFEGFKVDVIRYWLADLRTMERIAYDGFADQDATPQASSPQSSSPQSSSTDGRE